MQPGDTYAELMLAQRHIMDFKRRVARQQALVDDLLARTHPLAPLAQRVLAALNTSLAAALFHADRLERALEPQP